MKFRVLVVAAVLAMAGNLAAGSPAYAQAPSMSSSWKSVDGTIDACVQRAQAAVRAAGMTRNFETVGDGNDKSVFGESRNGYTAEVRCIMDKGLATFVVVGSEIDECRRLRLAIIAKF